ncbi:hypothetical protein B0A50_04450 [Salinomyces thailandicus]|uniref:Rhodopsin domain-containing protein n=1 Tax=Salinomyces thailandicus TaxID=706561 RepID=A0A4U0TYQ9_9PEZI|nr:hypothetical protein B0A50_04450 [Salinomyces thailandica]
MRFCALWLAIAAATSVAAAANATALEKAAELLASMPECGNTTKALCSEPLRDETTTVSYVGAIGGVLALIAYILRMVARLPFFGGSVGLDDAVITFAVMEIIPLSVLSVVLADLGLGKDIWNVPFDNITAILKVYYFDEDLYLTALPLVKISMLLFYLRIFPQKWFRWSSAALNVILDIVVIGLPMPLIAKLQLNKRKKFLVFLMFSVGFVVTAVSILRLQVLVQFGGSTNFTWHYRAIGYWSTAEVDLAVICACMPGLRALITWALPKLMGESTRANSPGPSGLGNYGKGQHGLSYERRSRASRNSRDPTRDEKDFIPLVEVKTSHQGPINHGKDWSLETSHPEGTHSSSSLGRTISMEA